MTFSEESKLVLQELFANYPPEDGDPAAKIVGNHKEKDGKIRGKKDDIFSMPSMNKADITKKVESLNSRIEKDTDLRKVILQLFIIITLVVCHKLIVVFLLPAIKLRIYAFQWLVIRKVPSIDLLEKCYSFCEQVV